MARVQGLQLRFEFWGYSAVEMLGGVHRSMPQFTESPAYNSVAELPSFSIRA